MKQLIGQLSFLPFVQVMYGCGIDSVTATSVHVGVRCVYGQQGWVLSFQ